MSIGGYDEGNAAPPRRANPARLQVETARIAVDFDGASGFGDCVEHLFDPALEGRTRWEQPAERVPPDFKPP